MVSIFHCSFGEWCVASSYELDEMFAHPLRLFLYPYVDSSLPLTRHFSNLMILSTSKPMRTVRGRFSTRNTNTAWSMELSRKAVFHRL